MAKAKKERMKPKSKKSINKTSTRIKKNHEIINKLLAELNDRP